MNGITPRPTSDLSRVEFRPIVRCMFHLVIRPAGIPWKLCWMPCWLTRWWRNSLCARDKIKIATRINRCRKSKQGFSFGQLVHWCNVISHPWPLGTTRAHFGPTCCNCCCGNLPKLCLCWKGDWAMAAIAPINKNPKSQRCCCCCCWNVLLLVDRRRKSKNMCTKSRTAIAMATIINKREREKEAIETELGDKKKKKMRIRNKIYCIAI